MTNRFPSLLHMLGELVATPSVSSVTPAFDQSNRAVIDLLAGWLDAAGFHCEVMPVDGADKANLIATRGSGPGGLVLSGHTDTVPFDERRWNSDPFRLAEKDGRFYGLGTCDMKGFFALALEAAGRFAEREPQRPLIILATADEESSMAGAKALVKAGRPRARHAVIGEPTGLRPVNAHKGILMEAVHLLGHSGHSSDPALGNSALEGMHRVLGELIAWRGDLQQRYRDERFRVPVPTLNLGRIVGGDNPNRICAECELHFDLRPLPGMELEPLREEIQQRLAHTLDGSGLTLEVRRLFSGTPAMETGADAEIVRAAEELTGHHAEAVAFGTEGPYLNEMGMETVILGPGDIDQAHQPDEFLAADRLWPTVEILERLIGRFCF